MFCPSCGAESPIELNYCNRCGANLTSALQTPEVTPLSVTKPVLIIGAVLLFITLGGFVGVLSAALEVVKRAGGGDLSLAIVSFGMITILTIDVLLFILLWKLINAALSSHQTAKRKRIVPPKDQVRIDRPTTAQLEPAPSVTENTTRFFEPVYREARRSEPAEEKKR
jgi:uncharacterized paraquat-inducible protein A